MVEFKGIEDGAANLGFENARRFTPSLHGPMTVTTGARVVSLDGAGIDALDKLARATGRDDIGEKLHQIGEHLAARTQEAEPENRPTPGMAPGAGLSR